METKVTAVNGHGHLTIGGLDTVALALKYGTPLYVMDEDAIRANCRALKNSMDAHYHKKGLVLYASKAFCCKRMYRILNEEGLGADVVSGGELYTALQAGFPAERIYFHGNNKTADELTMALESGWGVSWWITSLSWSAGRAGKGSGQNGQRAVPHQAGYRRAYA